MSAADTAQVAFNAFHRIFTQFFEEENESDAAALCLRPFRRNKSRRRHPVMDAGVEEKCEFPPSREKRFNLSHFSLSSIRTIRIAMRNESAHTKVFFFPFCFFDGKSCEGIFFFLGN